MTALFKNPIVYLSTSFALFLLALPLISRGTTGGPRVMLWMGLAALGVAALIPPVQRLICEPTNDEEDRNDQS